VGGAVDQADAADKVRARLKPRPLQVIRGVEGHEEGR